MTKIIWTMIDNIIVNNALMTARRTVAKNGTTAGLIVDALEVLNIIQTMNDIGEIKGGITNMPRRYDDFESRRYENEMRRGGRRRDSRGRYMHMDDYPYYEPIYRDDREMMMRGRRRDDDHYEMGFARDREYDDARLSDKEMRRWIDGMETADINGNVIKRGEKFTEQQAMDLAKKMGYKFDKFDEKTYWATLNMLYSSFYCIIGENSDLYARLAKAWLCNENEELYGEEKLMAYYCYIVEGE